MNLVKDTHLDFELKLTNQVLFDFDVQREFLTLRLQLGDPSS